MSDPVLVTGAAGFVAGALVERLRGEGREVIAADLNPAPGIDTTFNICDEAAVSRVMREHAPSTVVHAAALVDDRIDADTFERVNVGGTHVMLEESIRAGVKRFVQVSSIAALGPSPDVPQDDESAPAVWVKAPYFGTKARSEALVKASMNAGRVAGVVVRPGDVWGPGSDPWVKRPITMMKQRTPVLIDGGRGLMSPCHIDNLVDGMILAIDREEALGGVFTFHDGAPLPYVQYINALADAAGLPRPRIAIPRALALVVAAAATGASRTLGTPVPLTRAAAEYVCRQTTYDLEHSRRVLGYEPRVGLRDGMRLLSDELRNNM